MLCLLLESRIRRRRGTVTVVSAESTIVKQSCPHVLHMFVHVVYHGA